MSNKVKRVIFFVVFLVIGGLLLLVIDKAMGFHSTEISAGGIEMKIHDTLRIFYGWSIAKLAHTLLKS